MERTDRMDQFGPIVRNWGYYGPAQRIGDLHVSQGQYMGGFVAGIMTLHSWLPKPPGHVGNASSYPFPVRYMVVEGADQQRVHGCDEALLPALIDTARRLERDGCRMIAATCGYFGHFQKEVADAVDIPVYLSAVCQVPWIRVGLRSDQKIGILCGDAPSLKYRLFESCGISREDYERCVIYGAQDAPIFSSFIHKPGHYDVEGVKGELVSIAKNMVRDHPDIGAILLECTDMPPHAADIQRAVNLPVFDSVTMIKFIKNVVCQQPYYGFL